MERSCIILPIKSLTRARLFKPSEASAEAKLVLKTPGRELSFDCRYDPVYQRLTVATPTAGDMPYFEVDIWVNASGRRFFRCGCCLQPRNFLILTHHRLLCRTTYTTEGSVESKAMREARYKIALESSVLEVQPRRTYPPKPDESVAAHSGKHEIASSIPCWFTTEKAIILGRGASQFDLFLEVAREPPNFEANPTAPHFARPESPSLTNAHPNLDINVFRTMMVEGKLTGKTLCWGERAEHHEEVLFLVDWRGELPIVMAIHDLFASAPRWQRLPLTRQASGRFRFICPITGKGCQKLYLRGGLFGSRQAQRLYHPSQRAAGRRSEPSPGE